VVLVSLRRLLGVEGGGGIVSAEGECIGTSSWPVSLLFNGRFFVEGVGSGMGRGISGFNCTRDERRKDIAEKRAEIID
jgi:hypothetical protein